MLCHPASNTTNKRQHRTSTELYTRVEDRTMNHQRVHAAPITVKRISSMAIFDHPLWLVALLFTILLQSPCDASYTVTLENDEQECFFVRSPDRPTTLSGDFDCWEEAPTHVVSCGSIKAWIEQVGTNLDVWRSTNDTPEETFSVEVDGNQRYKLCFETSDQKHDDESAEYTVQLGFNIRVQSKAPRALPDEELGPDAMRAVELLQAATRTEDLWKSLLDHFDFLRNREAVHRKLTAQINDRVMGWTVIEATLVIVMAVGQVMYWKTFFEQRRFL